MSTRIVSRVHAITGAAFVGSLAWGTILPFQYAYVTDTRQWGALVGVLTGTMFCVGAIVAAPVAGRLADRYPAGILATILTAIAGLSCVGLGLAAGPVPFLAAMAVFGAAITAIGPATQVLVLDNVGPAERRAAFAYQFTAMALGMAAGAFLAGHTIDLTTPNGMWPSFAIATAGFALSAVLLHVATDSTAVKAADSSEHGIADDAEPQSSFATYRALLGNRQIRLLGWISIALAAGFYAQFDTGLPALALQSFSIDPGTVGTAAAMNSLVVVALQWIVVRRTSNRDGAALLIVVGGVWAITWLGLEFALYGGQQAASLIFVTAFMLFAVGETLYAPILHPLTAAVAPAHLVGTTLGMLSAVRTAVYAAGPLVAGLLLSLGLSDVFVVVHVAINAVGALLAFKLLRTRRAAPGKVNNESAVFEPVTNEGAADLRSVHV